MGNSLNKSRGEDSLVDGRADFSSVIMIARAGPASVTRPGNLRLGLGVRVTAVTDILRQIQCYTLTGACQIPLVAIPAGWRQHHAVGLPYGCTVRLERQPPQSRTLVSSCYRTKRECLDTSWKLCLFIQFVVS